MQQVFQHGALTGAQIVAGRRGFVYRFFQAFAQGRFMPVAAQPAPQPPPKAATVAFRHQRSIRIGIGKAQRRTGLAFQLFHDLGIRL
ncbi:MAG: hypothetical protein WCO82_09650, partial [Sphingomonadales bacterium]